MPDNSVIDNPQAHRFELSVDGHIAFVLYGHARGSLRLIHTEVPADMRGGGIGSKLIAGVLEIARERGLKVTPQCPFVSQYLKRHPEYADVIAE